MMMSRIGLMMPRIVCSLEYMAIVVIILVTYSLLYVFVASAVTNASMNVGGPSACDAGTKKKIDPEMLACLKYMGDGAIMCM